MDSIRYHGSGMTKDSGSKLKCGKSNITSDPDAGYARDDPVFTAFFFTAAVRGSSGVCCFVSGCAVILVFIFIIVHTCTCVCIHNLVPVHNLFFFHRSYLPGSSFRRFCGNCILIKNKKHLRDSCPADAFVCCCKQPGLLRPVRKNSVFVFKRADCCFQC